MLILAERLIAYLKTQTSITSQLSDSGSIFIDFSPLRKEKFIVISSVVGEDGNNIPSDSGLIAVTVVVSRSAVNACSLCIDIGKLVDNALNRKEVELTSGVYKVLSFVRDGSPALGVDDEQDEYYFTLEYNFILQNN